MDKFRSKFNKFDKKFNKFMCFINDFRLNQIYIIVSQKLNIFGTISN